MTCHWRRHDTSSLSVLRDRLWDPEPELTQVNLEFSHCLPNQNLERYSESGGAWLLSHGLPRLGELLCLPLKRPTYSSSLRRGPERKTSQRGRVCGRRRTRSGGGRLLLGINDQSFIWPNSRGRMGNLALGLTWQICQGGRATGDFYQIVNYPFRTARAKQPNLPLASPRGQRLISVPDTQSLICLCYCLLSSPPRSAAQNCSTIPVRCIFQNRRSRRRPSIGQTLRARYDCVYSAARNSSRSVEIL